MVSIDYLRSGDADNRSERGVAKLKLVARRLYLSLSGDAHDGFVNEGQLSMAAGACPLGRGGSELLTRFRHDCKAILDWLKTDRATLTVRLEYFERVLNRA